MWDQQLIEKYNVIGPRYTSYPTALQFEESYGNDEFKRAINHLPKKTQCHYIDTFRFVILSVMTVPAIK
jgi:oxygen-independent coproporphyrinogen-3 oxidase